MLYNCESVISYFQELVKPTNKVFCPYIFSFSFKSLQMLDLVKIQNLKTENGNIIMRHALIVLYFNKIYTKLNYILHVFVQIKWSLSYQLFRLFRVFLLSDRATWSLSRLHKVHMLVWFELAFIVSIIFHLIVYFTMLLYKFYRWFASQVQFLGLFLRGLEKEVLCSLYLEFNDLFVEPI